MPGTPASPRPIAITATADSLFSPNIIWVAEGETVAFSVTNEGAAEQELVVGPLDATFANTDGTTRVAVPAGGTAELQYTFPGAGRFGFASHVGESFLGGMYGYIVTIGPGTAGAGTPSAPRLVPLKVTDAGFNRPALAVRRGETVTFLISNEGTKSHSFVVGPAAQVAAGAIDQVIVVSSGDIAAGHVASVSYTFPDEVEPFAFASTAAGDAAAGLQGTIDIR